MSTLLDTGPPSLEKGEGPVDARAFAKEIDDTTATSTLAKTSRHAEFSNSGRQQVFDALAATRRRSCRPSTGLRASGYRQGFACGGTDALRRVWAFIPTEHRGEVARIAADYRDDAHA